MKLPRVLGFVAFGLCLVAGCQGPPGKRSFNDRMARDNKELAKLGFDFRKSVALVQKGTGNAASLRSKCNEIETVVNRITKFHADGLIPVGSSAAQGFQDAYRGYTVACQKMNEKMKQIASALETNKSANVATLLADIATLESNAMEKVLKAQKTYAAEHYYKMVPKYASP